MDTEFSLADGEDHMVQKKMSGARIEKYRASHPDVTGKINQLYGDSAKFDFSQQFNLNRCCTYTLSPPIDNNPSL